MFEGFSPRTIDFMWNIRFYNNKAWFNTRKAEYLQDFYAPMKALRKIHHHETIHESSASAALPMSAS